MGKPKLIVFDLDYTLWPFWVDTHVTPPFRLDKNNAIIDRSGQHVKCYPDVPDMLHKLKSDGILLGVASRTTCIKEAKELIHLFRWEKLFDYVEIYPDAKTSHFNKFHLQSKIPYKDMLFFDDESRNVTAVRTLGVTCVHAPDGMSFSLLQSGLAEFNKAKRNTQQ